MIHQDSGTSEAATNETSPKNQRFHLRTRFHAPEVVIARAIEVNRAVIRQETDIAETMDRTEEHGARNDCQKLRSYRDRFSHITDLIADKHEFEKREGENIRMLLKHLQMDLLIDYELLTSGDESRSLTVYEEQNLLPAITDAYSIVCQLDLMSCPIQFTWIDCLSRATFDIEFYMSAVDQANRKDL